MKSYSTALFIALQFLLIQCDINDQRNYVKPKFDFRLPSKQSPLESYESDEVFTDEQRKLSIRIEGNMRYSCTKDAKRICGSYSLYWCCPVNFKCGSFNRCTKPSPFESLTPFQKISVYIIIFIICVITVFRIIMRNRDRLGWSNNSPVNRSNTRKIWQRSITHDSIPTHDVPTDQPITNYTAQYSQIPETVRPQLLISPTTYNELSQQGTRTVDQQSLLPLSYNNVMQNTNHK
ncbi:hypothetical protein I4U23_022986 [Adineta vaga]|nr:hypothetical protein I4U23_022986 [Adineta vaga]